MGHDVLEVASDKMHLNYDVLAAEVEANADVMSLVAVVHTTVDNDTEIHNQAVASVVTLMKTTGFPLVYRVDLINQ